jgi:hypothetical protein
MRRRRLLVCLAAATLALSTGGAAHAVPPEEVSANQPADTGAATSKRERERGLPFSGLDLALLTAGAVPLVVLGAALRRRRSAVKVKPAHEETLTLA